MYNFKCSSQLFKNTSLNKSRKVDSQSGFHSSKNFVDNDDMTTQQTASDNQLGAYQMIVRNSTFCNFMGLSGPYVEYTSLETAKKACELFVGGIIYINNLLTLVILSCEAYGRTAANSRTPMEKTSSSFPPPFQKSKRRDNDITLKVTTDQAGGGSGNKKLLLGKYQTI